MKKTVVMLTLAAVLAVFMATGCGRQSAGKDGLSATEDPNISLDGTMPIIKDPSKFPKMKMAVVVPPERIVPTGELTMVQKLKRITGLEFEWQEIPSDGSVEKLNLMLASGADLPDAFWNNISGVMVAQYMDQDILWYHSILFLIYCQ